MTTIVLEQVIYGIITGSIYALTASGVALIYGTMRILNFSQGEFYTFGGYVGFFLLTLLKVNFVVAILGAAAVMFCIGAALHFLAIRSLLKQPDSTFSAIAVTLGLSIALQNTALLAFGEHFRAVDYFASGMVQLGEIRIPMQRLLIFITAVVVMGGLALLLKLSRVGMAIRATSEDAEAAAVMGIPSGRIHMLVFGLSAALASVAAVMLLPITAVTPWAGLPLTLKSFVIVVLGGLGSFPGAIVGGLLLGVVEALGVLLTSSEWQEVFAYAMVVLVIWVKPDGIFGKRGRRF